MGQAFPTGPGTSPPTERTFSRARVKKGSHRNNARPAHLPPQAGPDAPEDLSILAQSLDTRTDRQLMAMPTFTSYSDVNVVYLRGWKSHTARQPRDRCRGA